MSDWSRRTPPRDGVNVSVSNDHRYYATEYDLKILLAAHEEKRLRRLRGEDITTTADVIIGGYNF